MNLLNEIKHTYETTKVYGNDYANNAIAEKVEKYLNYCLTDEVKQAINEEYGSMKILSHVVAQHFTSNNGIINESVIKEDGDELLEGALGALVGKGGKALSRWLMKRGSKAGSNTLRKAAAGLWRTSGKLIPGAASKAAGKTVGRLTVGGLLSAALGSGKKVISGTSKLIKNVLGSKIGLLCIGGLLIYNHEKWIKDENGNLIFGGSYEGAEGSNSNAAGGGGYDLYSKAYGRPYQYVNKADYEI